MSESNNSPMRIEPAPLKSFAVAVLTKLGAPGQIASTVADSLLTSDAAGHNTHGLGLLPLYAAMIADRATIPDAVPVIEEVATNISRIDGRNAFGQLTGLAAARNGIDKARRHGLAVTAVRNGAHLGRLGELAELTTASQLVLMAFTNTGGGAKNVAPFGGHERKLSTNPIAFGIPTFGALPFDIIVDFATSQISGSVIRDHDRTTAPLNPDWTTTAAGLPVADAKAFMEGVGALLPLGGRTTGHKGFGLALVAELLGALAGGAVACEHDPAWFSNAALFITLDPSRLIEIPLFEQQISFLASYLRDPLVRLPGERAYTERMRSEQEGIHIPDHVLSSLSQLGRTMSIEMRDYVPGLQTGPKQSDELQKTW